MEIIDYNNYQWPSARQAAVRAAAGVHNVDAFIALLARVTSLTNIVKGITTTQHLLTKLLRYLVFIVGRGTYLIIVSEIQLPSIIWVTLINKINAIHV